MCVRSYLCVASTFLQHVLATKNVGNIILIGGKVMIKCGKDIMIGVKWMKSPYPTLSNACVAVCCLNRPQPCLALSFLSSNVSMLHFDRRIHRPPILSLYVPLVFIHLAFSFSYRVPRRVGDFSHAAARIHATGTTPTRRCTYCDTRSFCVFFRS